MFCFNFNVSLVLSTHTFHNHCMTVGELSLGSFEPPPPKDYYPDRSKQVVDRD